MIAGMTSATGGEDIRSHLHLDGIASHSNRDIANIINSALLQPMQDYMPLSCLPPLADDSELLTISPSDVCNSLLELNPRKAGDLMALTIGFIGTMLTSPLRHSECIIR